MINDHHGHGHADCTLCGETPCIFTLNNLSKGRQATNALRPRVLRHNALNTFGKDPKTSRVAGTSLTNKAWRTTSVRPLSCNDESKDGSWNTYAVTTSVANKNRDGP